MGYCFIIQETTQGEPRGEGFLHREQGTWEQWTCSIVSVEQMVSLASHPYLSHHI